VSTSPEVGLVKTGKNNSYDPFSTENVRQNCKIVRGLVMSGMNRNIGKRLSDVEYLDKLPVVLFKKHRFVQGWITRLTGVCNQLFPAPAANVQHSDC